MARPIKQGIDYFPADVNMFGDRKIKRLLRAAGGKGFTIYIYLLTNIYEDKGYYYEWDEHSAFDVSDDLNFSEGVVEETVQACCSIGLFNEDLFSAESILTSESIQDRWQKIVKDANRSETRIEAKIKISDGEPLFLGGKTELSAEETPKKSKETSQSKVKDSKGKKSKEKYRESVRLKEKEYNKLCEDYDKPFVEKCLDKLNNYKLSKGKKYKSDYRAILSWVIQAVQEDELKQKQNGNRKTKADEVADYILSD